MVKIKKSAIKSTRTFMIMEATSFADGGFPAFLNGLMYSMTWELEDAGYLAPFTFRFSGGDGVSVPVRMHATVG